MTEQVDSLVAARSELDVALTELRRIDPKHVEQVDASFASYFASIAQLEMLTAAGQNEAAHALDVSTVDPAFDALSGLVREELAGHREQSERAESLARTGTLTALLWGSLAFTLLFIRTQRAFARTARLEGEQLGLQAREADLRKALDAAHAANQATRQFLTMMSHELRTPLQAITGYAELLLAGSAGALTPDQTDDVRTIHRGADRLVGLIKQMLDVSRLEAGQMTFTSAPVDLLEIIDRVRQDVTPQAAAKGLKLSMDVPRDLTVVMGDTTGIHQVLLNLAGNAVKFTEAGEVRIEVMATGGEVAVSVRDTGIGMSQEELPVIFEEFRQVDHGMTRLYEGAGLGLTIARKMTELMGGRLSVESQPGEGSTFTLHLPSVPINAISLTDAAEEIITSRTPRQQVVQPSAAL
jgi:signal transduction histidine kinase